MHVGAAELTGDSSPMEGPLLATAKHFRFGTFEFHTSPANLANGGVPIKVRPQALQVLELLLSRAGETVTREQLRAHLWGNEEYLDHERGINSALLHLRKALNDDPHSPSFIETVPRQGYRFIAPIELSETPLVSVRPAIAPENSSQGRSWGRIALIASVLAIAVSLSVLWGRFAETPVSALPRLMIYPMHTTSEGAEVRPSAVSLTDDLVRILVTDFSGRLDLTAAGPQEANGTPAATAGPTDADFMVMSSLSIDGNGDFSVTLRLVRAPDRTIVWADTKHVPSAELVGWPSQAAADLLAALDALPVE
jgi:DNA-binding winged helix-turn-helix (wHTH) protein